MRDPDRIDRMIERLRELWHASPDLRLGQLLVNVIRPGEPCPRIFYAEDTDTEAKMMAYPAPVESIEAKEVTPLVITPAPLAVDINK